MKKIILVALIAMLVASCCPCKQYQKKYGKPFIGTEWKLIQLEGRTFATNDNYMLTFSKDQRVSGVGECNRIMGSYIDDKDGALEFNQMASTRMMCPNMENEMKFMQILESVDSYKLDGKLLMMFAKGEMLAVFEAK